MNIHLLSSLILISMAVQAAGADSLTADGLRAWLSAGGAIESNARLIHTQMQQQKASLPPWWPEDVYAQEEDAIEKVDFVDAGLPFYQVCLTESQARLLAKVTASVAGQRVAKSALQTHSQAAEGGADPVAAQAAGQAAAAKTVSSLSIQDRQKLLDRLTPAERALAQNMFAPAKAAALQTCFAGAFAKTADAMKPLQQEAVRAVVEANRPKLNAAESQWEKNHSKAAN